jgi:Yip1 domain
MSNRQIQPVRPRENHIARQVRPRSLWGQIWTITLQPDYFFRTLPSASDTRQWFWVALLILGLVGLSAVRQEALQNPDTSSASPPIDFNSPSDNSLSGSPFGGPPSGNIGSPDAGSNFSQSASTPNNFSSTLTTALIAASHILLGWFILSLLLSEIALFNGYRPSFSQNLQVAIWTTVPLGIMAGVQVVYYAVGGGVGQPGLSGLLSVWKQYSTFPSFTKSIVLSTAIRITLFWLWSLVLIYRGGTNALGGKRWTVTLVVVAWSVVLIITPVITGAITANPNPDEAGLTPIANPLSDNPNLMFPSTEGDNKFPNGPASPLSEQPLFEQPDSTPELTPETDEHGASLATARAEATFEPGASPTLEFTAAKGG